MFQIVKNILFSLVGQRLSVKVLSAVTDGASNMKRSLQVAVIRIERECSAGFFRICCLAH